jgi:catechol 2,3-dioxygenase-like lactoylglutathione lyase family enzyme
MHHLAICTADIRKQIEFFSDKLGMELVALYWMHGAKETMHGFMRLGDESSVAFVHSPKVAEARTELGRTHAGNPVSSSAPGTLQHVALKVKDEPTLLALRDRLRAKGVPVLGPVDHGFCTSIYFGGPENLTLELSFSESAIDAREWIDPEVVSLAGISAEELEQFKSPPEFVDSGGQVEQPTPDSIGPHLSNYPEGVYEKLIRLPDDQMRAASETDPPVMLDKR